MERLCVINFNQMIVILCSEIRLFHFKLLKHMVFLLSPGGLYVLFEGLIAVGCRSKHESAVHHRFDLDA